MEAVRLRVQIPENHVLHLDVPVPDAVVPGAAHVTVIIEPVLHDTHPSDREGRGLADLGGYLKSRNPHPDRRVTVEDMSAAIAQHMRESS